MAQKQLRYVGSHAAVVVPLPDGRRVEVERNGTAAFDDELAGWLLTQPANWELAEKPKRQKGGE